VTDDAAGMAGFGYRILSDIFLLEVEIVDNDPESIFMTDDQVSGFTEAFQLYDADDDGEVSVGDIKVALTTLGVLFDDYDID
jgi:hypothetical protein